MHPAVLEPGRRALAKRTTLLQRVLLAGAPILLSLAGPVLTASPASAATTTICKTTGSGVPAGYVITAETISSSCTGAYPNAYIVTQPATDGSITSICKTLSYAPNGFVVVGESSSTQCPGSFPNTSLIKSTTTPPTTTTTPAVGNDKIRGVGSNRCVDVPGASQTSGTKVILFDCRPGVNQVWTYTASKQLKVYGTMCLDGNGASGAGARVIIWGCHGGANQQWTLNSDGTIRNGLSGLCLDAFGGGTANGTEIAMWPCNAAGSNQRWTRS
jgi:hypothetical protein